jgi:hypothetical protein
MRSGRGNGGWPAASSNSMAATSKRW